MTDPKPEALPAVELDGELCVMCFLPADTRAAELSRGTAEQLSALLSVLSPETRAGVLAEALGKLPASLGLTVIRVCEACKGAGGNSDSYCHECRGLGRVPNVDAGEGGGREG